MFWNFLVQFKAKNKQVPYNEAYVHGRNHSVQNSLKNKLVYFPILILVLLPLTVHYINRSRDVTHRTITFEGIAW